MSSGIQWTNHSVLTFAKGGDPVEAMETQARAAVLQAMDDGWRGPPFDPLQLAELLKLKVEPRADIPDARTIPTDSGLSIEFNPSRPRGRLRFSIAHEIAHSFFPDCADFVRNRGGNPGIAQDDWQLEVLCNIGAAELLMPTGSFPELAEYDIDIHKLLELRKTFDVSVEALLIRTVKLTEAVCAAFCAAFDDSTKAYRLDYLIPSRSWRVKLSAGINLPSNTLVSDANAIGFTAVGEETWKEGVHLKVQCVGLAPYPGEIVPRVVGIVSLPGPKKLTQPELELVTGDALAPRGDGPKILAHVIPDSTSTWGGRGFAAELRKKYPGAAEGFKDAVRQQGGKLFVGQSFRERLEKDLHVFHMVAQHGHGSDQQMRVRYSSLVQCLNDLRKATSELHATVHMPKIGTGHGGGDWKVIRELILDTLVRKGVKVTVYQLP